MSARDRDWLQVLHEVGKGHLTQKEGGTMGGDGTVAVRFRGRYRALPRCETQAPAFPLTRPVPTQTRGTTQRKGQPHRRRREGFDLRRTPPRWAVLKPEQPAVPGESR